MSRWEQGQHIYAEISPVTGEVMLSASDVIAWLRFNGGCIQPVHVRPAAIALADALTDRWLDATRNLIDGGGL